MTSCSAGRDRRRRPEQLLKLAVRKIVKEALETEAAEAVRRAYYEIP